MLRVMPLALAAALLPAPAIAESVTVFAAASLTDAVEEIAAAWAAEGHEPWRLSFGGSSTLAQQIIEGAPADIFLSANERWMDAVEEAGLIEPESRANPLSNSLVLIAPAGEAPDGVTIDETLDLAALLGPDGVLAMADPAHVPAGLYGREALETLGLWARVSPQVAATQDVRAALALVERGEAPLGIVYSTDAAISDGVEVVATFPAGSHAPITYPVARLAGSADSADAFAYLLSDDAMAVFARHGFVVARP